MSILQNKELDQLLDLLEEADQDDGKEALRSFFQHHVQQLVKQEAEKLMKTEREAFLDEESEDEDNKGNGYYSRDLDTRFGPIEDLDVPRDRSGEFSPKLFEPYKRRDNWLEEMIIGLYSRGISTREIADLLQNVYGSEYSSSTISRITDITLEEVQKWKSRDLNKKYLVLYIDGFVVDLRRDTVGKETIYLVCGVNMDGHREVLGFYVGGNESATVWEKEVLEDIRARGVKQVLLVVSDDLSGLQEAVKMVFPKADWQPCMAHKIRNALSKCRVQDREELAEDLKKIYQAPDRQVAERYLQQAHEKWSGRYPEIISTWEEQIDQMLTFMKYPEPVWSVVYTTNWIERTIKEYRKRLKPMNSIPTLEAAEKIVYLRSAIINRNWSERKLRGFKSSKLQLHEMMEERYPSSSEDT